MNKKYDGLTTWDFWSLEEKLWQILHDKGYGIVEFDLVHNSQGQLKPCMQCSTKVCDRLAEEIRNSGYTVETKKRTDKKRFSYIFIKDTYPVELLEVAEQFKVIV